MATPPEESPGESPEEMPVPMAGAHLAPTVHVSRPTTVLTPPAQAPSRGVPGPQYELERSPFLTDEEVEEEGEDEPGPEPRPEK